MSETRFTAEELHRITGFTFRTLKKRLAEAGVEPVSTSGRSPLYDRQALRVLLRSESGETVRREEESLELRTAKFIAQITACVLFDAIGPIACLLSESPEFELHPCRW
jgi:hypothetical protein